MPAKDGVSSVTEGRNPLSEATLMQAAEESTGLANWGEDQRFRTGLQVLIDAMEATTPSTELRASVAAQLLELLTIRLHLVDDHVRHPEILDQDIERPLVIIGLPRTGTTILYDLLALDPRSRSPREWEAFVPWPAPEVGTFESDPRIDAINASYDKILEKAPEFATIQRLDARQPGECNHIMTHHFASTNFAARWPVPNYQRWFMEGPVPGLYETHKRVLQQLQWKGPRGNWLLKSPVHLFDLGGLLAVYPDAELVWTHRDPATTFSSLSSMTRLLMRAEGVEVDKAELGNSVADLWVAGLQKGVESRQNPAIGDRILDLSHREVVTDPVAAVRKVYEYFGRTFMEEHADLIADFVANSPAASRIGKHKHAPEEYGLDPDKLRRRLSDYYDRFGELCKKPGE